jgi:hypothetical protein
MKDQKAERSTPEENDDQEIDYVVLPACAFWCGICVRQRTCVQED